VGLTRSRDKAKIALGEVAVADFNSAS